MELILLYDQGKLASHIEALDQGAVASPTPGRLVQFWLGRARRAPKHAKPLVKAAANAWLLSRSTKHALTLEELAGSEVAELLPQLLAELEAQAREAGDALLAIAGARLELLRFTQTGHKQPERLEAAMGSLEQTLSAHPESAVVQCQLHYELGAALLWLDRQAEAGAHLEAAASRLEQAAQDPCCRVPRDRLVGLQQAVDPSGAGSTPGLVARCRALAGSSPEQLAELVVQDALSASPQLPQSLCAELCRAGGAAAAAALFHTAVVTPGLLGLSQQLINALRENPGGAEMLLQHPAPPEAAAQLAALAALCRQEQRKKTGRPAKRLKPGGSAETSHGPADTPTSGLFVALDSDEMQRAAELADKLPESERGWARWLCEGGTGALAAGAPTGELFSRVVLQLVKNRQLAPLSELAAQASSVGGHGKQLLAQATGLVGLTEAWDARNSPGALPSLIERANQLCAGAGSREHIELQLRVLISRADDSVLEALTAVIGSIAMQPASEVLWEGFGPECSQAAALLASRRELVPAQPVAVLLLEEILGQLVARFPDTAAWRLGMAQLQLLSEQPGLALDNLVAACALESNLFADECKMIRAGPVLKKMVHCCSVLGLHSIGLALAQYGKEPELARATAGLANLPASQLEHSWFKFIWQLPLLELLMHKCSSANATAKVAALTAQLNRPELNQWNSGTVHAAVVDNCKVELCRALFERMAAQRSCIQDLQYLSTNSYR